MSSSINTAFVKQFEREVHEGYQRMGSKLRGAVRSIPNVQGSSTVFQKVGKGTASTKSNNGMEFHHPGLPEALPVFLLEQERCQLPETYFGR